MIRKARGERSLRDVQRASGVSFATIRDIERGDIKRPGPETLEKLSAALGIPYRDLALAAYAANGDSPPPTPPEA